MNEVQAVSNGIDILTIDAVSQASVPFETEMKDPAGKSYPNGGIFFLVIGRQADEVNRFFSQQVNEFITKREYARRRGKEPEPKTAEQAREDNILGSAVRVVGWRGVTQAFDKEVLKSALRKNPQWMDQIVEASDDLGNYTKKG